MRMTGSEMHEDRADAMEEAPHRAPEDDTGGGEDQEEKEIFGNFLGGEVSREVHGRGDPFLRAFSRFW
jgi:hypothetical protein